MQSGQSSIVNSNGFFILGYHRIMKTFFSAGSISCALRSALRPIRRSE
jgi:hypothetical protein